MIYIIKDIVCLYVCLYVRFFEKCPSLNASSLLECLFKPKGRAAEGSPEMSYDKMYCKNLYKNDYW